MKNSAFEDFSEGAMEAAYEAYDFKTCQRSDGTTYGTAGDCVQKGSKEVSKSSSKKKTSKKSSWDDSNLAAKMGSELGQVAAAKFTSGILKGFSKDSYERAANVAAKVQEMYASGQVEAGTALMRAHASGHNTMVKESLAKAGRDLDQKAASAKTRAAKENSRRQAEDKARLARASAPAPATAASKPSSSPPRSSSPSRSASSAKSAPLGRSAKSYLDESVKGGFNVTPLETAISMQKYIAKEGGAEQARAAGTASHMAQKSNLYIDAAGKARTAGDLKASKALYQKGVEAAKEGLANTEKLDWQWSAGGKTLRTVLEGQLNQGLKTNERMVNVVEREINPPPKPKPRSGGSGSSSGSVGSLTQQIQGAMNDVFGPDLMGAMQSNAAHGSRWPDGSFRTAAQNGTYVRRFNSYQAAIQDANSGFGMRQIQRPSSGMMSGPSGNLQGSREIIRGRR